MNTIQNLFQQAQLAEAAYVNLTGTIGNQMALELALNISNTNTGGTFSDAQAADFATHWRVADHLPDTGSGFSATVFRID